MTLTNSCRYPIWSQIIEIDDAARHLLQEQRRHHDVPVSRRPRAGSVEVERIPVVDGSGPALKVLPADDAEGRMDLRSD
jgi:hypothetical protein